MRLLFSSMLCFLLAAFSPFGMSYACTSFCLDTPDGQIYATNLDLVTGEGHVFINRREIEKEGYGKSTAGEVLRWVAQYGSVTFNLVGRELPWGGMNEAGLVMSTMQLNSSRCPSPDERPPLGEAYLVQFVLDSCANVQEAIQTVSTVRLAQNECTSHFLVADEAGDCAVLEFLNGEFVYFNGATLPVKALANASYAAGIAYIEQGVVPIDNPGASVERVAAAAGKASTFQSGSGDSPVEYSFHVLAEVVSAPKKWWSNLFGEPYTRWNVVFDISKREVHFRTESNPKVRHISLHNFSLSCDAPVLMLDVNEKLEGPVDRYFQPYDHGTNLKTFKSTCGKLGISVSEENAVALVELFESFECEH